MASAFLIFPHQLFEDSPALTARMLVYLIEDSLFFNQFKFHKKKLIFHRATMKAYAGFLSQKNIGVQYIESTNPLCDVRDLVSSLSKTGIDEIHYIDVADNWLRKRITASCEQHSIKLTEHPTPNFLNTMAGVKPYFHGKTTYFQTAFYIDQRKQRKILLDAAGNPEGGQWSFDADNRLKFPKNQVHPAVGFPKISANVTEAHDYVEKHYAGNYGNADGFMYPTTHEQAKKWLDVFLKERFEKFGIYEDAIVRDEHFLHHSVISPLLNVGLLNPEYVINTAIRVAGKYKVPINSVEGFIRQIMGWREFIRIVYEREGSLQRTKNYWGFDRKIPESFWTAGTGILPVDSVIRKVLKTGYCHHIERLMVMGNFMLLCEFDPDEVYRWFMELFIDAYDWVMVPNVYGMTQFADGGLMTTKPYISGSNYLMKMSDYPKGKWTAIWDALFWRFMHVHRDFFLSNSRLGMLIRTFDKMPKEKQDIYIDVAEEFLENL